MEYVQWANDALAHLGFYRCPHGSLDCSTDIKPKYQDQDPWQNETLGTCTGLTIGSDGCAISSVAMLLQRFNIDMTPRDVDTWLKNFTASDGTKGYASAFDDSKKYIGDCWIHYRTESLS